MTRRLNLALLPVCALALTAACARQSTSPASPSGVSAAGTAADSDGSTLKVSAPTPQSPSGGTQVTVREVTLAWSNSAGVYVDFSPTYRVQLMNAGGTIVYEVSGIATGSGSTTSHLVTITLDGAATYTWRVRAEYQGAYGPWSSTASFISPVLDGYIKGNELYDPLDNGKTVGVITGPTHFVPGVGLSLDSLEAYVAYELPQTLTEGEFSILATNVRTHTEGGKTKILTMSQGYDDITTNDRRMTVEKRSDGTMAWRLITHDDQIDTGPEQRLFVQFNLQDTFFFRARWRNNFFDVSVKRDGPNGESLYNTGESFKGRPYRSDPARGLHRWTRGPSRERQRLGPQHHHSAGVGVLEPPAVVREQVITGDSRSHARGRPSGRPFFLRLSAGGCEPARQGGGCRRSTHRPRTAGTRPGPGP